jgi:hypothetical protein
MSRTTETSETVYRPLQQKFKHDGFSFQLVARQGKAALFAKTKAQHTVPSYEVVIVQTHEATTWPDGRVSPSREAMPSSEDWGKKGWTPGNWRAAIRDFKALVYHLELWNQPCIWLWPDDRRQPPPTEWVLGREIWEKKHGLPASWVAANALADETADSCI